MKIEIVDYKPEHIMEIMESDPRSPELYWCKSESWNDWKYAWEEKGPAYTMFIDGKIIGSAGVVMMNKKSGEAWMVMTSRFYDYKKEVFKAVKGKLDEIINGNGLVRIQALVITGFLLAEVYQKRLSPFYWSAQG